MCNRRPMYTGSRLFDGAFRVNRFDSAKTSEQGTGFSNAAATAPERLYVATTNNADKILPPNCILDYFYSSFKVPKKTSRRYSAPPANPSGGTTPSQSSRTVNSRGVRLSISPPELVTRTGHSNRIPPT